MCGRRKKQSTESQGRGNTRREKEEQDGKAVEQEAWTKEEASCDLHCFFKQRYRPGRWYFPASEGRHSGDRTHLATRSVPEWFEAVKLAIAPDSKSYCSVETIQAFCQGQLKDALDVAESQKGNHPCSNIVV